MTGPTLRCFITAGLREVLPEPEDAAFLARLDKAMKARFGAGAGALLDASELACPGPASPHRIEDGDGRELPGTGDLAQELVIRAFNQLFC
jgi:hypothetical protein